jgi:uncharacterized radical SAM superfamily Fe-S cluster-containing enzyme
MADQLLRSTTSLCSRCFRSVVATLWRSNDQVVMRKSCPDHGPVEALVSSSADWYESIMKDAPALQRPFPTKKASQGCPYDCGPCTQHEQQVQLPIDSFKPEPNKQMLDGSLLASKLKVLTLLEKHGVDTTLLPVLARGYNDSELGDFVFHRPGRRPLRPARALHPV